MADPKSSVAAGAVTEGPFALVLGDQPAIPESLGGKGASLARLVEGGHHVPATGVVSPAAYRRVAAANPAVEELVARIIAGAHVEDAEVDATFAAVDVPADVRGEIATMASRVGEGGPVAVRSSATVEDMSGSSFAGQYQSLLDIDSSDTDKVLGAVQQVWASLWHAAPTAYRTAFGIDNAEVAMAVVVMAMIPAETAGVIFTVDPGGTDGARVEAVEGLGESLVSGERTPSAWVVRRPDSPDESTAPDALDAMPTAARTALDMALAVEESFEVPQDIEWAAADSEVYVVQARPITVLETDDGFDTPIDEHELTTSGIAEMVPGVQPPLRWEVNQFILEEAFRSVLDSLGIIRGAQAEVRPFVRRVRGRVALDFDQLRNAASHIPGAADQLEEQYFGHVDPDRPGASGATAARSGRIARMAQLIRTIQTRRLVIDGAEVLIHAMQGLRRRRPMLDDFEDEALLAYGRRLVDLAARGLAAELGVAAAGGANFDQLLSLLEGHLGPEEAPRAALAVTAHSGATMERQPWASAAVFAGPTWAELGSRLQNIPDDPEARAADLNELEARLQSLPGWRRRRILTGQFIDVRIHVIRRTVHDVIEQLRRREAAKAAVLELGGEVRRVHLELGSRLAARGVLNESADVDLLTTREIADALQGQSTVHTDTIGRRRNWLSRYEVEGELPVRFRGVPDREPAPLPEGDVLEGWAASPGRRSAPARVVRTARGELQPGEVLVAETTDASWSPLFVKAGAVVVERGGPLSHAAILARELGLPAVLNVEGATGVLDGCTVSVDGDQGVVVIESRPEQS
ncbi:MAG: hypothetical protein HKN26_01065 [Acidimicrobiales bacterium]|nr:hypothetical protein [Acidimicrobiales bacterium]